MLDVLLALIVDESKWLTASLSVAALATAGLLYRDTKALPRRPGLTAAAMSLFFAVTIGAMAGGHLLAVTVKVLRGTLDGPAGWLYLIGAALALPSWLLVWHAPRAADGRLESRRRVLGLNAWTAATLLVMGLHNLPLTAPGLLSMAYLAQPSPLVGRVLVGLSVVINAGLLAGSLVFLASGQSFEQFRGLE